MTQYKKGDRVFHHERLDRPHEPMAARVVEENPHVPGRYVIDYGALSTYGATPDARDLRVVWDDSLRPCAEGIGPRSDAHVRVPDDAERGTVTMWQRRIYGSIYSFTSIVMPDGERCMSVSKYNGYVGGPRFACAWTAVHWLVRKAST